MWIPERHVRVQKIDWKAKKTNIVYQCEDMSSLVEFILGYNYSNLMR